jgi:hypothetical protein
MHDEATDTSLVCWHGCVFPYMHADPKAACDLRITALQIIDQHGRGRTGVALAPCVRRHTDSPDEARAGAH